MIPTSEITQRLATLFGRKLSTHWSEKEVRRYDKLIKDRILEFNDLELIERYYVYQRKRENGIHRRDLYTFLNNFSGELDRARAWDEEMRERLKRKVRRPLDNEDPTDPTSNDEWARIGELARKALEEFKNQFA